MVETIVGENGKPVYIVGIPIEEEIELKCREKGVETLVKRWKVSYDSGITIYALSVAWFEDEELHHFVTTLESF